MSRPLILGAGLAGISAALSLRQRGLNPILLEARSRVGGRVETSDALGLPLDLGAGFVHGATPENPIFSLAQQMGLNLIDPATDEPPRYHNPEGVAYSDPDADRIDQLADTISRKVRRDSRTAPPGATVEESLAAHIAATRFPSAEIRAGVEHALAAEFELIRGEDAAALSLRHTDSDKVLPGADLMIREGFAALLPRLTEGLDIRTGVRVEAINRSIQRVIVETDQGPYEADTCIITIPIGVLQSGAVRFNPGLPPKVQDALGRLGQGAVNKVILRFPERFWPAGTTIFGRATGDRRTTSEFYALDASHGVPILIWFLKGNLSRAMESWDDAAVWQAAKAELDAMFPDVAPLVGMLRTRWFTDPLTRGSHTIMGPAASPADILTLQKPIDKRLAFAGEGTDALYPGTAHGAWLSGQRAAALLYPSGR